MNNVFKVIINTIENNPKKDLIELSEIINPKLNHYLGTNDDHLWNLVSLVSYVDRDKLNCYLLAREDFKASDDEIDNLIIKLHETGLFEILNKLYWEGI